MKPSVHIPGQARQRRAFTLIELIVAVAILTVLILGIGLVFRDTTKAVNVTEATMDIESSLRVAAAVLQDDFRQMSKDGILAIINARDISTPPDGVEDRPSVLLFTATGRFQSMTGGQERNSAWIVFKTGEDSAVPRDAANNLPFPTLLERRAYVLTGPPIVSDGPGLPGNVTDDQYPWSLSRVETILSRISGSPTGAAGIWQYYVQEFPSRGFDGWTPLDTTPLTLQEVKSIWPYMAANVKRMDIYFTDGRTRDDWGIQTPPGQPAEWLQLQDVLGANGGLGRRRYVRGQPATFTQSVFYYDLTPTGQGTGGIMWTPARKEYWPTAIKIVLTMRDSLGRTDIEPTYEIILKVP